MRLERDLQADLDSRYPGKVLSVVTGVYLWAGTGGTLDIDDLAFSNSLTTEHNVLGGGSIGHLLRQRVIHPTTFAATDRWFHYDQVGSVLSESDATGNLAQSHHQDAFGNTQASWQTGLWGGDRVGWHHNTKELDGDTGLVYMYQRWYLPEVGVFASSAPYPVMMEHRYSCIGQRPTQGIDADGQRWVPCDDGLAGTVMCWEPDDTPPDPQEYPLPPKPTKVQLNRWGAACCSVGGAIGTVGLCIWPPAPPAAAVVAIGAAGLGTLGSIPWWFSSDPDPESPSHPGPKDPTSTPPGEPGVGPECDPDPMV